MLYRGYPLLLQLITIPLTIFIVLSGFDWWYFVQTQNPLLRMVLFPAAGIGALIPLFAIYFTHTRGRKKNDPTMTNVSYALLQSGMLGLAVSSFYKIFTGRIHPPMNELILTDISHEFHFGFFREGIFWGWPSSHTTVAFAMAVTLVVLYPKNIFVRFSALAYALYIGLGVSIGIHWFSEFIAGMCIGTAIGLVVGKSFSSSNQKL